MGLLGPKEREIFQNSGFCYITQIEIPLEAFREYINSSEKSIREIYYKIKDEDKYNQNLSNDEICYSQNYDMNLEITELYYTSLFVFLYSFLEKKMEGFCKIAEKEKILKIKDMSGEGVKKYKKYLEKVVGINLIEIKPEWDLITQFNALRNILIHSNNHKIIGEDKLKIIESIEKNIPGIVKIKGDDFRVSICSRDILDIFIKKISVFLEKIYYEDVK